MIVCGVLPATPAKAWILVALFWIAYLLNHADRQVVYVLFPALQKEFGFSNPVLGLTGSLFLWVFGICSPLSGVLADRISKAHVLALSIALWSLFTGLSGLATAGWFLLMCRAFLGVAESMFMPAAAAMVAAVHKPAARSRAIATFATGQMAGVAIGGTASGFLADHYNWRYSFWVLGITGILFAVPLWFFLRTLPAGTARAQTADLRQFFSLLRVPSIRIVTAFVAIATFGTFLVNTWLPTFLFDKFALTLATAGREASTYPQMGMLAGLLAGGTAADLLHPRWKASRFYVVVAGFLFAAPCIFWLGASSSLQWTRIAGITFGFFIGSVTGNQVAASLDVAPKHLHASTVGVLNLLGASLSGLAPLMGGFARQTIGVGNLMSFTALLFLIAAGLVLYGAIRHFPRDHAATSSA